MSSFVDYLEIDHIYAQTCAKGLRTVAICAANSNEGVSTLACALAERAQKSGCKTLLVDMNYFRPSLDARFSLPRLAWSGDTVPQATLNDLTGIHVITACAQANMSLRHGDVLAKLIQQWQQDYDCVVFDTSPLNALNRHNLPAELVCSRAQATLMVVRSGVTPEADILAASTKLTNQQANLIGVVMNDIDCPSLSHELRREVMRIERWFPRVARWLRKSIANNTLVNMTL